ARDSTVDEAEIGRAGQGLDDLAFAGALARQSERQRARSGEPIYADRIAQERLGRYAVDDEVATDERRYGCRIHRDDAARGAFVERHLLEVGAHRGVLQVDRYSRLSGLDVLEQEVVHRQGYVSVGGGQQREIERLA